MFSAFAHYAVRHGWKNGKDLSWPIWLLFSIPRALRDDAANTEYRANIFAIWRARWWHETREHIVIEMTVTIGSSIGAASFASEFLGKAMLGALAGGLGAIVFLSVGQLLRSIFSVRRSVQRVNTHVQLRFDQLIRIRRRYQSQICLNPQANKAMYEQRQREAESYASEVDGFLKRYYPDESIGLSAEFINLKAPPFDNVDARTKHIDRLNSSVERGTIHLERIEISARRPKPTPLDQVA